MSAERIQTFSEFWPYYLSEHRLRKCRALHYVGTACASLVILAILMTGKLALIPLALVAGYGPAWIAHFFIEKNRPATFTYPFWSLAADYKMFFLALQGKMQAELSRHLGRGAQQPG